MVVLTDVTWAVCSADVMGVPWVVARDASSVVHWAESLAAGKDVMKVVVSVESMVAMWVVVTVASTAVW